MKKFLLIFTALFCFVLLCSCGKINEIPEGEYALCIDDKDGLLAEPLKESYKPGEIITVKVHVVCDANAVATLNGKEGVYKGFGNGVTVYEFTMPEQTSFLKLEISGGFIEPTWELELVNHTGIDNLFLTTLDGNYAEGETIEINVNPDALMEDRGIILKSNGVLIEDIGIYEWNVIMPSAPLKIDAYLINASFGENWKYLNVIDKNSLLAQVADGYYQVGNKVVIYTDYLIDIIFEDGMQIDGLCVDEGEGIVEYIYSFEMPNSDLTVEITRQNDDNNNNE